MLPTGPSESDKTGPEGGTTVLIVDPATIVPFLATHARLLDRRWLALLLGRGEPEPLLRALAAYRNDDGGYGSGLEPDQRSPSSQPIGALHALELLEDAGPAGDVAAHAVCDWLGSVARPDGGVPFSTADADGPGVAAWFAAADRDRSSLHLTAALAGGAQRIARRDPALATHPWLVGATRWCLRAAREQLHDSSAAMTLRYVLQLLDALVARDDDPALAAELERLAGLLPASATVPVAGGTEDEAMRPLDFAPTPGTPLRSRIDPAAIAADLDRLAGLQREDGGWPVEWASWSPAGTIEWRGTLTVRTLRDNGRLDPAAVLAG